MDKALSHPRRRRGLLLALTVWTALLLAPAAVPAAAPPQAAAGCPAVVSPAPLFGWSFQKIFGPVESFLGERKRMMQMATLGMAIGLFILMRK
jgi:hypothetical protein